MMAGNNILDVKGAVEKAIGGEWEAFEQQHPHLAAALDRELLVEQATAALAEDPGYQEAMAQTVEMGVGLEAIGEIVIRFVRQWMGAIL
jgi:hypothetical protein